MCHPSTQHRTRTLHGEGKHGSRLSRVSSAGHGKSVRANSTTQATIAARTPNGGPQQWYTHQESAGRGSARERTCSWQQHSLEGGSQSRTCTRPLPAKRQRPRQPARQRRSNPQAPASQRQHSRHAPSIPCHSTRRTLQEATRAQADTGDKQALTVHPASHARLGVEPHTSFRLLNTAELRTRSASDTPPNVTMRPLTPTQPKFDRGDHGAADVAVYHAVPLLTQMSS